MALTIVENANGVNSAVDSASVTSPGINAVICDSGAMGTGGTYICQVFTVLTGTADALGGGSNIYINVGGTNTSGTISGGRTIGKLPSLSVGAIQRFRVSVQAGEHIYLCVGDTAPTAGAIYSATLSATRGWHLLSDT